METTIYVISPRPLLSEALSASLTSCRVLTFPRIEDLPPPLTQSSMVSRERDRGSFTSRDQYRRTDGTPIRERDPRDRDARMYSNSPGQSYSAPSSGKRNGWYDHRMDMNPSSGFSHSSATNSFRNQLNPIPCIVLDQPRIFINNSSHEVAIIQSLRQLYPTSFLVIYDPDAAYLPHYRLLCFDLYCNMVAHDVKSLMETISTAVIPSVIDNSPRDCTCPYCHLSGLTTLELWHHLPTYHVNVPPTVSVPNTCPICQKHYRRPLQVHIHEKHGPLADERVSITQLYCFALVVCRHPTTGRFLLCQEFSNQGFWLPGGAVDNEESPTKAAKRETMEEAGIDIDIKGILSLEYNPVGIYDSQPNVYMDKYLVRIRVVFYAEPTAESLREQILPKSSPDFESVGACWCSAEDILEPGDNKLKLRGNEPRQWVKYLLDGGSVYPLSILKEKEG